LFRVPLSGIKRHYELQHLVYPNDVTTGGTAGLSMRIVDAASMKNFRNVEDRPS
jgi:hypothetical protein